MKITYGNTPHEQRQSFARHSNWLDVSIMKASPFDFFSIVIERFTHVAPCWFFKFAIFGASLNIWYYPLRLKSILAQQPDPTALPEREDEQYV